MVDRRGAARIGAPLALYRAQEALGVLMVTSGPVDATDEPAFDSPPDTGGASGGPVSAQPAAGSGPPAARQQPRQTSGNFVPT